MNQPPTLDVSHLPASAFDSREPPWWGNTLLLVIETTTVALLVVSYFYARQASEEWPPPRVDENPTLLRPVPDLKFGTLNAVLLTLSCLPMLWVDLAARRHFTPRASKGEAPPAGPRGAEDPERARAARAVGNGLLLMVALGLLAVLVRVAEFRGLHFRWDDNAYASLVWSILGLHLVYLVMAAVEAGVAASWVFLFGLDQKRAADVTLVATTWYWTAGTWLLLYGVVYWSPRVG
jgi:cytochrome c oxidase subunit III